MTPWDAHITFCDTPDLEATARFYEEVMGLPLALDQGSCRNCRVADMERPEGARSRVVRHTGGKQQ